MTGCGVCVGVVVSGGSGVVLELKSSDRQGSWLTDKQTNGQTQTQEATGSVPISFSNLNEIQQLHTTYEHLLPSHHQTHRSFFIYLMYSLYY